MAAHDTYRVLAGRVRMLVREWPGENPPVVFLHSFTANSLLALRLGDLLIGKRRLLAPDLRGRGGTDTPFGEYGAKVHVRDITALLDRMKIDRCVLAGHSFGATIAVFLAAQLGSRISGLILFDGGAVPADFAVQALDGYYSALRYRYPSLDAYTERFKATPTFQPYTEELDTLLRSNLYQQPDGTYIRRIPRFVIDADRRGENLETWNLLPELYPRITCPVLVLRAGLGLYGPEDQVLTDPVLKAMVSGFSNARVTVENIPYAGHTSLLTIPSPERDQALLRFLDL